MRVELVLLSTVAYRGTEITAPKLRELLALLAADLATGATARTLVEELWPRAQPANPLRALHVLVSRLRTHVGADLVESTPTGYRLTLHPDQVDAATLRSAATHAARATTSAEALAQADRGLDLWDGTGAGHDDALARLKTGLIPAFKSLARTRALAQARLGRHQEALEPLNRLREDNPRDEELLEALLQAQAATAGPAQALSTYETYRRGLREDLGADPGPQLRAAHQELLQGPVVKHGVAHEPNALLGRDQDITAVTQLLATARVTSIVGPGGLGKTRLAHAVGRASRHDVYFVSLAAVTTDEDVAPEVAAVTGAARLTGDLVTTLGRAPAALLVLDNCEHVLDGAAELVTTLVEATEVTILTTSRAPLGLTSESVHHLAELPIDTAVNLFTQRARAARPGADLPRHEVAEICGHLDGLPLAIELAAARVRVLSVTEIAKRLDDRFTLLRGGSRDAPQRHQTLHAVVDWSWTLLGQEHRAAMAALSVFPGGFTTEAAEYMLGGDARTLEHLVDQSLLKAVDTPSGVRLHMLETVREFSAVHRHDDLGLFLAWARDFGRRHFDQVFGHEPMASIHLILQEQDNLVQAVRYAVERNDAATVATAAAALCGVWLLQSNHARISALATEISWLLSHFPPTPEYVEATRMAAGICGLNTFMIRGPRAVRSLVILRRLPAAPPDTLPRAAAVLLTTLARRPGVSTVAELAAGPAPLLAGLAGFVLSYLREGDLDPCGALDAARRMAESVDDWDSPWFQLSAHIRIGELALQNGEVAEAQRHYDRAMRVVEPAATDIRLSLVLCCLHTGDLQAAERWLARTEGTYPPDPTFQLGVRAEILLARGEIEAGLRTWRHALAKVGSSESTKYRVEPPGMDPWQSEIQAAAVVAHARHGRLDLIRGLVAQLPARLAWLLEHPTRQPSPFLLEYPVWGALLLAIAVTDLAGADAARMIAIAERFRFLRSFQPTMSPRRARQAAEQADPVAYAEAVSAYATLDRDELRADALQVLLARANR
ncbi:MAG: BTAD domain-containing putative transcriptional regulator [Kibdelosporangium sp.]